MSQSSLFDFESEIDPVFDSVEYLENRTRMDYVDGNWVTMKKELF